MADAGSASAAAGKDDTSSAGVDQVAENLASRASLEHGDDAVEEIETRREVVSELTEGPSAKAELRVPAGMEELLASESWEDLRVHPILVDAIRQELGWARPTKIQSQALPYILKPENPPSVLGQAKNGSGKTGCFTIGMVARVDVSIKLPQSLCLCPTREVATNAVETLRRLTKNIPGVEVALITGGHRVELPVTAQLLVATPGKLSWLLKKGKKKEPQCDMSNVDVFVLDEADDMMEFFREDCKRVHKALDDPQVLLFSASFELLKEGHGAYRKLADTLLGRDKGKEPVEILIQDLTIPNLTQFRLRAKPQGGEGGLISRVRTLRQYLPTLMDKGGKVLIFANTIAGVGAAADALSTGVGSMPGMEVSRITSKLSPTDRARVLQDFKSGKTRVVVTTDVLARGVDVKGIKVVVNLEIPKKRSSSEPCPTTFQHRCGRTARAGAAGTVVTITNSEADTHALDQFLNQEHFRYTLVDLMDDPDQAGEQIEGALMDRDASA